MKVMLVDDHSIFRAGLVLLLKAIDPQAEIVDASRLEAILERLRKGEVADLLLLDLYMPDGSGMRGIDAVKSITPSLPVIVISSDDRKSTIVDGLERGASGFVPKGASPEALESALRMALRGEIFVPREALSGGSFPEGGPAAAEAELPALTQRQLDVLDCLLRGMPNKLISRELGLSEATARQHTQAVFRALGVASRAQVVAEAMRRGLRIRARTRAAAQDG